MQDRRLAVVLGFERSATFAGSEVPVLKHMMYYSYNLLHTSVTVCWSCFIMFNQSIRFNTPNRQQ